MPRSIAVSIPAITAVLSAFCAPAPELIVRGTTPRINHRDVIRMGRRRSLAASTAAENRAVDKKSCHTLLPFCRGRCGHTFDEHSEHGFL